MTDNTQDLAFEENDEQTIQEAKEVLEWVSPAGLLHMSQWCQMEAKRKQNLPGESV